MAGAETFSQDVLETCAAAGVEIVAMIEGRDRGRCGDGHQPPVIWIDDQAAFEPELPVVIGVGQVPNMLYMVARALFLERLESEGRSFLTVWHPSAVISPSAILGDGCVVLAGAVIAAGARIGRGTVINRSASIGHHTVVGGWSFIGPGAVLAGEITAGEQVHVGVGASVRDRITIGDRAVIGAGAAAVKDVLADTTVVGVPARAMERD